MANAASSRIKQLMAEESAQKTDIAAGKNLTGILLIVWIATRLALYISEVVCAGFGYIDSSVTASMLNIVTVLIGGLFALCIYSGVRLFAILPIIGGVLMLAQCFTYGYFSIALSADYYMAARVYAALFVIASAAQTVIMIFLLANKKTRAYFDAYKRVSETVIKEKSVELN